MDYQDFENWADLANAVVLQAVEDYRETCRALERRCPGRTGLERRKESLERFFLSGWFRKLSALDGKELLQSIQKEMQV